MGGPAIIDGKKYKEFDNFYLSTFSIDRRLWRTSEHYYQSRKCTDEAYQYKIHNCWYPSEARKLGQECTLRPDWEEVKVNVMFFANLAKFTQNTDLAELLIGTGEAPIIFKNSTPFWNESNAKILEEIREILRRMHANV